MNMDWQTIMPLLGGGGLGWLANWWSARRRERLDLVAQAHEMMGQMQSDCADKTQRIRALTEEVHRLTCFCHETEMRLVHCRCDRQDCPRRQPPLPWQNQNE